MYKDERLDRLKVGMRLKHYELEKGEYSVYEYFERMAEEVLEILDDYYGGARYWMATEFQKENILRELQSTIDRIRNANIST